MTKREYDRQWRLKNRKEIAIRNRKYYEKNKKKIAIKMKKYQLDNKDKLKDYKRQWYLDNEDYNKVYQSNNKDKIKEYYKEYYSDNREKIKEYHEEYNRKYESNRRKTDLNFKIRKNLRSRLYKALKNNQKVGSAVKDLGCSIDDFKKYIESKFRLGMTWDNHGEWHLDHIIPLSSFTLTNREEFLKANHFTNIQPLWKIDNIIKGNKIL